MKKIIAIFVVLIICFSFVSPVCRAYAAKNATSHNVMDLIRLKKYIIADSGYNADFDYNGDNRVNAQDLITLKRIILGVYQTPDDSENPKFDDDGYYNDVIKP